MTDINRHAEARPDKAALIDADSGSVITYAELNSRSIQCARLFAEEGLGFGDHIAVMAENLPETLIVAWAAFRSGLYVTPVNWHLTADEAGYVIRDCMAKLLVISPAVGEVAKALGETIPGKVSRWIIGPATGNYRSLLPKLDEFSDQALAEELQGAMMFYSSGTTGRPKGILRDLARVPTDSSTDALLSLVQGLYRFSSDTVYLCPAPLYHAAPIAWTMAVHRLGGTVVLMRRFDAALALELIERYRVNRAQFVPTMFVRMLKLPTQQRLKYDISSLEVAVHAAAPCPIDIKRAMLDWWGPIVYEYYSGSEGSGFTAIGPQEWLQHPGSVGKSVVGVAHVVDDHGDELPCGEVGTLYFEGNADFRYHDDEVKTREAFNEQGWSTAGDMGYLDEEGYIYLTDRKSNMIISGGVNIYPQEAENVLTSHPQILDVAVIGVPDPEYGEAVKAVVQLIDGAQQGPELEQDIIAYCQRRLARFKCPRSVEFVDELPRLPTGKLLKRLLH